MTMFAGWQYRFSSAQLSSKKEILKINNEVWKMIGFQCLNLYFSLSPVSDIDTTAGIIFLCIIPTWLPAIAMILWHAFLLCVCNFISVYFLTIFPLAIISMSTYTLLSNNSFLSPTGEAQCLSIALWLRRLDSQSDA